MKTLQKYWGVALIVIGIIVFVIYYFAKVDSNAMLLTGLFIILIGVAGEIHRLKKEGGTSADLDESFWARIKSRLIVAKAKIQSAKSKKQHK